MSRQVQDLGYSVYICVRARAHTHRYNTEYACRYFFGLQQFGRVFCGCASVGDPHATPEQPNPNPDPNTNPNRPSPNLKVGDPHAA